MSSSPNAEFWQVHPEARRVPVLAPCLRHDTGDGDVVVYVLHTQELLSFNAVGTGVYLLIDGKRSVAEIVDVLLEELPSAPQLALQQVELFLADLTGRGALSFLPGANAETPSDQP